MRGLSAKLRQTAEGNRLYLQEHFILEVTEQIAQVMADSNVSRSELAQRLGKSKGYVTQLLNGTANMTLRTVADMFTALGRTVINVRSEEQVRSQRHGGKVSVPLGNYPWTEIMPAWSCVGNRVGEIAGTDALAG